MAAEKIVAQTSKKINQLAKQLTIKGSERFHINAFDFVISPLSASADLHCLSLHHGVENDKVIATLNPEQYTQISGLVPDLLMYIDTEETFYIKF